MNKNSTGKAVSGASDELRALIGSQARDDLACYFGVTRPTLQRWLDGGEPPLAVLRLARMRWGGDLADVLGKEWSEVEISAAGLRLPGWRRPFSAVELRSTFARLQQLSVIEQENARLRRERSAAWAAQEAAEDAADYYRHQLRLESRLGAMLQSLTA